MQNAEVVDRLKEQNWKSRTLGGFMGQAGPLWTLRERDAWVYGLLADDQHLNPAGVVHGGALCALIDHVLSTVEWEACERTACVTVQLDTHFLSEVHPGDFAQARGTVMARTGRLVFMDGQIQVEGRMVLTAHAVMKVLRPAGQS